MTKPSRDEIVAAAREYLGVPFKKAGRDKFGLDCVGLIILAGRNCGLEIYDTTKYTMGPHPELLHEFLYPQTERLPGNRLVHGSIAILRDSIFPMHTGIITTDGSEPMIINASAKARRVVEEPYKIHWAANLVGMRDYKGMI
ncbi:hypothetical protein KEU06_09660 [Pseudaminobacter sp. 19-2017]|uniref:NlpC/P60 domain-containing protein n=1 Tax=Pseudaminobacter soli (ex Zhang et al. 2022) TaxID=2831468 RepID=A0A942I212_9HYPH|nr:hypothetical protein [Pseudaminobacter soli]MBS3648872.1 hypothetical protein [Pseudaminobacter soli]